MRKILLVVLCLLWQQRVFAYRLNDKKSLLMSVPSTVLDKKTFHVCIQGKGKIADEDFKVLIDYFEKAYLEITQSLKPMLGERTLPTKIEYETKFPICRKTPSQLTISFDHEEYKVTSAQAFLDERKNFSTLIVFNVETFLRGKWQSENKYGSVLHELVHAFGLLDTYTAWGINNPIKGHPLGLMNTPDFGMLTPDDIQGMREVFKEIDAATSKEEAYRDYLKFKNKDRVALKNSLKNLLVFPFYLGPGVKVSTYGEEHFLSNSKFIKLEIKNVKYPEDWIPSSDLIFLKAGPAGKLKSIDSFDQLRTAINLAIEDKKVVEIEGVDMAGVFFKTSFQAP